MEAHNGLSAKIAEEAGFQGIWASGLSISASFGVRDCNEVSWTQILQAIEFMADAINIPILMDADTGFGNYNNLRRLVRKAEMVGVSGVCVEDKIFPKKNSLLKKCDKSALIGTEEFCGKIMAAKDTQKSSDFSVIARTEGFIEGLSKFETLERAAAYSDAGADAILVHSKKRDHSEIKEFMDLWTYQTPIVIVPTTYGSTPVETFQSLGISTIIWANHNMRSCVSAMRSTCKKLLEEKSLLTLEDSLVGLTDIFELTNMNELKKADAKYLPWLKP